MSGSNRENIAGISPGGRYMIITKIELLNFGPYYGKKTISFGKSGMGIHILYGENGQGKTSFQNAILWGLYGKVEHRSGKEMKPTGILNRRARNEDKYQFAVKIFFEHEGKRWTLTRRMHGKMHDNRSYSAGEHLSLIVDDDTVARTSQQIQQIINRIIPPEISQFFFFDGEMLNRYEMLLDEEKPEKRELKMSIEKILGIPFVSTAKSDLEAIRNRYQKDIRKILSKIGDENDKKILETIKDLEVEIEEKKSSKKEIENQLNDVYGEISKRKQKEREYAVVRKNVDERLKLESEKKEKEKELEKKKRELGDLLKELYKYTLSPVIKANMNHVNEIYEKEYEKLKRKTILEEEIKRIKKQIEKNICQCCGREIDPGKITLLKEELKEKESELNILSKEPIPNISIEFMKGRLERILKLTKNYEDFLFKLRKTEDKIYRIEADIESKNKKIIDLSDKISETDEEEVRRLEIEIRQLETEKGRLKGEKSRLENMISTLEKEKLEYDTKLERLTSGEVKDLRKRITYINYVLDILDEALNRYRDKKKEEVEKTASEIFKRIKTKKGFSELKIDENYGLWIISEGGEEIGLERSAGEEQIVAFCLIGALNKCSSIDAPVFMDTPFGRIDPEHTKNILQYLPELSKQVVLLVTSREFRDEDKKYILEYIKTSLRLINQGDEKGTIIEEIGGEMQ